MKLIIAGGRDFSDYNLLKQSVFNITRKLKKQELIIISGGANGADRLGERFAEEFGFETIIYKANWKAFGKVAGLHRNNEMSQNSDMLLAFWDKKSKGTKHMIETAIKDYLKVVVVYYE